MTSDYSLWARPIVIDTTNNNFTCNTVAITLTSGTYANIYHLLHHMETKIAAEASDVVIDGDCESGGTADWAATESTLSKTTSTPHGGSRALRITATAGAGAKNPGAYEAVDPLVPSKTYWFDAYMRVSAGAGILPRFSQAGFAHWTGVTDSAWQHATGSFSPVDEHSTGTAHFDLDFAVTNPAGTEIVDADDIHVYDLSVAPPPDVAFTIGTDGLITVNSAILDASSLTLEITWTDTALRDLLGFTAALTGDHTYTATYTPENCWFPSRARADVSEWTLDHKVQWKGVESRQGNVAGLRTGVSLYRTTYEFEALAAHELLQTKAASAIEAERSLDYFVQQSRESWGAVGQPSPGGFYIFPDVSLGAPGTGASFDSGDASKLDYSSSPDTFVFCAFDADWYPKIKPTLSIRSDYFDASVELHSATAPTWTGGD